MSDRRPHNVSASLSGKSVSPSETTSRSSLFALIDRLVPGNVLCLAPEPGLPCLYASRAFLEVLGYDTFKRFLGDNGEGCSRTVCIPKMRCLWLRSSTASRGKRRRGGGSMFHSM